MSLAAASRLRHSVVIAAAVMLLSCGQAEPTDLVPIATDDAEVNAAIAKARETLPEFWRTFEDRSHGESEFALKVQIHNEGETEHIWLIDLRREGDSLTGEINNEPTWVHSVELGDRIVIQEADISDWMYYRDGLMYGNQTMGPLLKRIPKEEADQFRAIWASDPDNPRDGIE